MDPNLAAAIAPGYTVFSSDHEKLGKVVAVHSAVFHVQKGFLFVKDYNVPLSAVARVVPTAGEVYLNVSKHDAINPEWELQGGELSDEPADDFSHGKPRPTVVSSGASMISPLIVDDSPNPVTRPDRTRR